MIEEKKVGKGKTIAIVILTILLIGSLGYIAYDLYFYKYFKKEVKVEEKKETKKEAKEVELKDNTIKRQVIRNFEQITKIDIFDREYTYSGGIIFDKEKVTSEDIPEDFKLYSAFNSGNLKSEELESECNTSGECKVINSELTEIQKAKLSVDGGGKYKISDVKNNIKEVYGTDFDYSNELTSSKNCPNVPVVTNEYFYTNSACGDTAFNHIEKYVYKVTVKENYVYVYAAVAYNYFNDGLNSNGITYLNSKIYKNLEKEEYSGNTDDFELNENNYQEFSKYKITFEKTDEGDYIFKESVRIEK